MSDLEVIMDVQQKLLPLASALAKNGYIAQTPNIRVRLETLPLKEQIDIEATKQIIGHLLFLYYGRNMCKQAQPPSHGAVRVSLDVIGETLFDLVQTEQISFVESKKAEVPIPVLVYLENLIAERSGYTFNSKLKKEIKSEVVLNQLWKYVWNNGYIFELFYKGEDYYAAVMNDTNIYWIDRNNSSEIKYYSNLVRLPVTSFLYEYRNEWGDRKVKVIIDEVTETISSVVRHFGLDWGPKMTEYFLSMCHLNELLSSPNLIDRISTHELINIVSYSIYAYLYERFTEFQQRYESMDPLELDDFIAFITEEMHDSLDHANSIFADTNLLDIDEIVQEQVELIKSAETFKKAMVTRIFNIISKPEIFSNLATRFRFNLFIPHTDGIEIAPLNIAFANLLFNVRLQAQKEWGLTDIYSDNLKDTLERLYSNLFLIDTSDSSNQLNLDRVEYLIVNDHPVLSVTVKGSNGHNYRLDRAL